MGQIERVASAWVRAFRYSIVAVLFGAIGCLSAYEVGAQGFGDLVVSPTRVTLEGRTRSETVTLSNKGSESATFRISVVNMKMEADGSLNTVDQPDEGQLTADKLIRYAPRQVVIPPGGAQTVRIAVRKPKDLAAGEYRSHMFFRAVPPETAGRSAADTGGDQDGVSVQLIPIFGITIPVIVRHGDTDVKVAMSKVQIGEGERGPQVSFNLSREGSKSAYGDVFVQYVPSGGGEPLVVGQATRLAVFTPNTERTVSVPLLPPPGITLSSGMLRVEYRAQGEDSILASGEVAVP